MEVASGSIPSWLIPVRGIIARPSAQAEARIHSRKADYNEIITYDYR